MKKNRKKADTYRFNGSPYVHSKSIQSVTVRELEGWVQRYEAKLADPNDPDDKKWTARWLERFRKELEKKRAGRSLKRREMGKAARITSKRIERTSKASSAQIPARSVSDG